MNIKDDLKWLGATIDKFLSLPALLVGFIIDVIALFAIFGVQQAESTARIVINPVMQLTIWSCAVITYFGFLRRHWEQLQRKQDSATAVSFQQFLSVGLLHLHYPFYLIPLVLLIGFYILILFNAPGTTLFLTFIAALLCVAVWVFDRLSIEQEKMSQRIGRGFQEIESQFSQWAEWISTELAAQGYTADVELSERYLEPAIYCRRALWLYHRRYGVEQNLTVLDYKYTATFAGEFSGEIFILTHRSLSRTRPWSRRGKYDFAKPIDPRI